MRLAEERRVRFRARFQCAKPAQSEWGSGAAVLRKELLDIDDMQNGSLPFLKGENQFATPSHRIRVVQ